MRASLELDVCVDIELCTGALNVHSSYYFRHRHPKFSPRPGLSEQIPEAVKRQAQDLLHHFPTAQDVMTIARREDYLQKNVGISQVLFAVGEGAEAEKLQELVEADGKIE